MPVPKISESLQKIRTVALPSRVDSGRARQGRTAVENDPWQGRSWAQEREINGRHVWVLRDHISIVEITDSKEALRRDHPGALFDAMDFPPR